MSDPETPPDGNELLARTVDGRRDDSTEPMTPEEEYEFYARPENQLPAGPPLRRRARNDEVGKRSAGRTPEQSQDRRRPLSDRLRAALEGCYEAPRAAALSGVPRSTIYHWARTGLIRPSVSPTRVKLWSYADLMALRIVYWLRHPKSGLGGEVAASPMAGVRTALAELEYLGLDIWDDSSGRRDSPLRVDRSARIWIVEEGVPHTGGQAALPGSLDLLGPFDFADRAGPNLIRPRPTLRIIPGRVSGEPHLAGSRITTRAASALYDTLRDYRAVAELYPDFEVRAFEEAIDFERSLAA